MRWLVFDTETNGLPAREARGTVPTNSNCHMWPDLVQLSWLIYDDKLDKVCTEVDMVVQLPEGITMQEEASKIHGITTERSMNGVSRDVAFDTFKHACSTVQGIVAHNLTFDANVMRALGFRLSSGPSCPECGLNSPKATFCTMTSTVNMCALPGGRNQWGFKYPRLEELHSHLFNQVPRGLHDSMVDVRTCFRCFYVLTQGSDPLGNRRLLPRKNLPLEEFEHTVLYF